MNQLVRLLVVSVLFLLTGSLHAAVPQQINYQGRLLDTGGNPVADGAQLVKFIIYDQPAGGTELWNSGFQNVMTENGLFNYSLGSNVPLPDNLFSDTSCYLGITIGVDPELSPRTRLESTPYAYHALRADTASYASISTGGTQVFDAGDVVVSGFFNLLASDSINCPDDGFVMVNLTTAMNCNHTNGDDNVLFVFVLEDGPVVVTQDQDNRAWALPTSLPSGTFGTFIHVHKIFPVNAGWIKYNALAFQNAGGGTDNFSSADATLSLLYFPQSLGTIEVGVPAPPNPIFDNIPLKY